MALAVRAILATTAALAVAGCNTAGTSGPSYEAFASNAATTSNVSAVALRTGSDGSQDATASTGTLTHSNGGLTLDDGTYAFSDPDGPNQFTGRYTDGASTVTPSGALLDTSGYEYVIAYDQTYSANGVVYEAVGLAGVATRPGDMPTGPRRGEYQGQAFAVITSQNGTTRLTDGQSNVVADFGAGTVNAQLNNFQTRTPSAGAAASTVDTILATDMAISGNTFSGGNVLATSNGFPVSVTGAGTTVETSGAFFGYDGRTEAPDEVGGVFDAQGASGSIAGGFVAD